MKQFSLLLALLGLPVLAFANSGNYDAALVAMSQTVSDWATGALGVGLATTMMLMGGAIGVARCSPMPTLAGVGGAAFLHWGPAILLHLVGAPAPQPAAAPRVANVQATKAEQVAPVVQQSSVKQMTLSKTEAVQSSRGMFRSSNATKWFGLGGAAVVLSLLGLLTFLSSRRKSGATEVSGTSSTTSPVFADPNGFEQSVAEPVLG